MCDLLSSDCGRFGAQSRQSKKARLFKSLLLLLLLPLSTFALFVDLSLIHHRRFHPSLLLLPPFPRIPLRPFLCISSKCELPYAAGVPAVRGAQTRGHMGGSLFSGLFCWGLSPFWLGHFVSGLVCPGRFLWSRLICYDLSSRTCFVHV